MRVGEFGMNSRFAIIAKKASARASTAPAEAP
jgi:hypothetical protein